MDSRYGLKKTYENLFFGFKKVWRGEIRLNKQNGKTQYHPMYPYEGDIPDKFEHDFAIAAIVKNEGRYLQEWIEFHRLVGCSKFFLYDNSSTDNTRDILSFYADLGVVDWVDWPHMNPWLNTQQLAYCHAIYKSRGRVRWLALIDADEFLFSPVSMNLVPLLNEYFDLPALIVYWEMFGTSGHQIRPEGLVIENYTKRLDTFHPLNTFVPQIKSIVQPHRVRVVNDVHRLQTDIWPVMGYDENQKPVKKRDVIYPRERFRLNHYYTKSIQDWNERLSRTWAGSGYQVSCSNSYKLKEYRQTFRQIHQFETTDTDCHYILPALQQRLRKNSI
jgi:hypothetical protein